MCFDNCEQIISYLQDLFHTQELQNNKQKGTPSLEATAFVTLESFLTDLSSGGPTRPAHRRPHAFD